MELPRCGGWVLERSIAGSACHDAVGCYPLFACRDWSQLGTDIAALDNRWVTLSFVADPFGTFDRDDLDRTFDVVNAFRDRYVVDLRSATVEQIVSKHHRQYALKALRRVRVEVCEQPLRFLQEWLALYDVLRTRHGIAGIRGFSDAAFARQLTIPGIVMFRATLDDHPLGIDLWYVQNDVAYGHLVAYNAAGYASRAGYALKWTILHYFSGKVSWMDLGGAAGSSDEGDGLARFKAGWSTEMRPTLFCGKVLDRDRYAKLTNGSPPTAYFPAYRQGEFAPVESPPRPAR